MKKPGILIAAFLAVLVTIGGLSVYAFFDEKTISEEENRSLAKYTAFSSDTWFSGDYAKGLESFLSDHVYERTELVAVAQKLETFMERKTDIKLVTHNASDMAGNADTDAEKAPDENTDVPGGNSGDVETVAPAQEGDNQQDRLVLDDRILQIYHDAPDALAYYSKVSNSFFAMFPDYVGKYLLVAPSRIAFETKDVAAYSDDQKAAIETIYDKLDPLVTTIDAYSALEANSQRLDDLYYRTDHHWTHLGAYYAAEAMFKEIGLDYSPLNEYERNEGNGFLGYYYAQDPSPSLKEHEDELIYYLPTKHDVPKAVLYINAKDGGYDTEDTVTVNPMRGGYYTFAGSSFAYSVMEGAKKDGGCMLLVADSYGNTFGTWLAENYERVIQIDPRDFSEGKEGVMKLADKYGVTDVMICDYLGAVDTVYFPSQIEHLTE